MNNTLTSPYGIDVDIQDIQVRLYEALSLKWGGDIDGYGRVYRNLNNEGSYDPDWYVGANEYKSVKYNDDFSCLFTFIDSNNHSTSDEYLFNTDVKVVFMVDLDRIFSGETDRVDSKAHLEVLEILRSYSFNRFSINGIEKGVKNVFSGFKTSDIQFTDIHPYHCFSVNIKLNYYLGCS